MARASVRGFVALASHPSPEVRKRAVELLARRDEPEARAAIVAALDGRDAEVCRAALAALEHPSSEAILVAIVSLLEKAETWSLRARAAESLGRARDLAGETRKRIGEALLRTAKADSFALVREAALSALAIHDLGSAKTLAQSIAATDDEPRLRQVAREIVSRH
jgi:HEAT repeat protein